MLARDIHDTGLRLGILEALLRVEKLDDGALREKLHGIKDEHDDEDERIAAAITRLEDVEIDESALAAIQGLDFDGGNDIYMLIEETIDVDTGGETDHYAVRSLAGVERLSSLRSLNLDGHGFRDDPLDLTPLRDHPTLANVQLTGQCANVAVLETLPKLTKLGAQYAKPDDAAVIERLRARGVEG